MSGLKKGNEKICFFTLHPFFSEVVRIDSNGDTELKVLPHKWVSHGSFSSFCFGNVVEVMK